MPGCLFVLAMVVAGILSRSLNFAPKGLAVSYARLFSAIFIGLLAYPAGFFCVLAAFLALLSFSAVDPPGLVPGAFEYLVGYGTVLGILLAAGMLVGVIMTAAFAVATRHWPRRAFGPLFGVVGATLAGTWLAGVAHYVQSMPLPAALALRNALRHPLETLGDIPWGIPLAVLVGEPLLAALLGHWFYRASLDWSSEQA